jgi:nitrogen fixation negative regulator NifL
MAAPPKGTPEHVLRALGDAVHTGESRLPPRLFYEAVEQSSEALSITDTHANILYANVAFGELTGYQLAELIGRNQSMLSSQTTQKSVYKELWATLAAHKPWSGQLVNRHKSGRQYLAEVIVAPILGREGRATHYLAMHRDVTEIHRLQKQLRNQKALIESVVDAAPVAIALLDETNRVMLDNHAYKKLVADLRTREPAHEIFARLAEDMGPELDRAREQGTALEGCEVELRLGGGHGSRWFSCSVTWFEEWDTSTEGFLQARKKRYQLLVANEITGLKQRQEALKMAVLRAQTAEQELVQSMQETLSAAVFQFEAPINLINAASMLVQRRCESCAFQAAPPLLAALHDASEAGRSAQQTLRASLPEGKADPPSHVNVNQLVREVLGIFTERLLGEGVEVDWQPAVRLPVLIGREGCLRGMLKQLIANALEAVGTCRGGHRLLRILTEGAEGGVHLCIEDSGPGIPEALRIKVFEPFFAGREARHHGAGMGLAMVQEIVNRHEGTVSIGQSQIGGCRVSVRLPSHREPLKDA